MGDHLKLYFLILHKKSHFFLTIKRKKLYKKTYILPLMQLEGGMKKFLLLFQLFSRPKKTSIYVRYSWTKVADFFWKPIM